MTGHWTAAQLAGLSDQTDARLPALTAADVAPVLDGLVLWDMWPIADVDGATAIVGGRRWWFFLVAPRRDDPDLRHDEARIRLLSHGDGGWRDEGDAFPDGFTPGSREWSGSAVLGRDGVSLAQYFTAAGRRGEPRSFEQRLFEAHGRLVVDGDGGRCEGWSRPREIVAADGTHYARTDRNDPVAGRILGFRDPGFFRDPADGADYVLFTGSDPDAPTDANGLIGIARRDGDGWTLLPPLLSAVGVNSELERPHIVMHGARYYLFWSTQATRFADGEDRGVNGLYAMVADTLAGPWRPANGTGLVAGNPAGEPTQAYCWWVTGELDVISFVDIWGTGGVAPCTPADRARRFGGTVGPIFRLSINGDRITIA